MLIRQASEADVAAIAGIERLVESPWNAQQIGAELSLQRGVQFVACETPSGDVVGWCCARLIPPEAELLKISVSAPFRRLGIAAHLLETLIGHIRQRKCTRLYLEVRRANAAATKLYMKSGFQQLDTRKNYYTNPTDDAIIYALNTENNSSHTRESRP